MKRPPQPCGGLLVSGVEEISDLLHNEILKREVIEGDKVTDAASRMKKAMQKMKKAMQKIARAQAKAAASSAQGSDSTSTVHSATEEDLDSADLANQSSIIAEED